MVLKGIWKPDLNSVVESLQWYDHCLSISKSTPVDTEAIALCSKYVVFSFFVLKFKWYISFAFSCFNTLHSNSIIFTAEKMFRNHLRGNVILSKAAHRSYTIFNKNALLHYAFNVVIIFVISCFSLWPWSSSRRATEHRKSWKICSVRLKLWATLNTRTSSLCSIRSKLIVRYTFVRAVSLLFFNVFF